MLTSIRGLGAATLLVGTAAIATPAFAAAPEESTADAANPVASEVTIPTDIVPAQPDMAPVRTTLPVDAVSASHAEGEESAFTFSGNVALASDYRFRGVSLTDGDPAVQGGVDLAHSSGLYVGTWASNITGGGPYGELELDIYAGWGGDIAEGVALDVGLLYYIYPTNNELANALGVETDYLESYASLGFTFGPVGSTFGVAYAFDQDALSGGDNLYLYSDFEYGIAGTPISLNAHLGYTDGVLAPSFLAGTGDDSGFDWGLGASWAITDSLSLGVNYADTQGPAVEDFTDAGFFVTLGYSM